MSDVHGIQPGVKIGAHRRPRGLVDACQHWMQKGVETLASVVLVTEVVILMMGIVARSVLHKPLVWGICRDAKGFEFLSRHLADSCSSKFAAVLRSFDFLC